MNVEVKSVVTLIWLALTVYYAITADSTKQSVRKEPGAARIFHTLLMGAVFGLLFSHDLRVGRLGVRLMTWEKADYVGLALVIVGAALAIWARRTLGPNWSAIVRVQEEHEVVHRGPYRLLRHPIYTGGLTAMLGTAIVEGEVGCFIAVVLACVTWWLKARMEEEFLAQHFGDDYRQYQQHTWQFIPFVF